MGTKMGPSYACLFMGHLEAQIRASYYGLQPGLYYRFIDVGIGITNMSTADLERYVSFVDDFDPFNFFTSEISSTSVNFPDIKVTIKGNLLHTSVYY